MNRESQKALAVLLRKVSEVRRWLVLLGVLRGVAAGLIFIMAYVGVFAVLDHLVHMPPYVRLGALVIFLGAIVYLLYRLAKLFGTHLSHSAAARHVEGVMKLDQQLVTAVEYHESQEGYPYSKALAEHVVLQVHKATARDQFDATVPKWQAAVSVMVILAGLIVAGVFLHGNYVFLSTYFARLARPLADVPPVPATRLVAITRDMAVEQDAKYILEAEIQGRVPEQGALEIESADAAASDRGQPGTHYDRKLYPTYAEGKPPTLRFEPLMDVGAYRYRFTAGEGATEWYALRVSTQPKVRSIIAKVWLPNSSVIKPYTEEVQKFALDVFKGSQVELTVQATEPLAGAKIKGPDGLEKSFAPDGKDTFTTNVTVEADGSMSFVLTGTSGIANERIPPLEVNVKLNAPADIELLSPDGDCLTSDVASIPINFEISDEFGLETAQLNIEIAGKKLDPVTVKVDKGATKAGLSYLLELENYPLTVGDTILYYAQATDIDIGTTERTRAPGTSDVHMIEIRPYRVSYTPIVPPPGGGGPGEPPPDRLVEILEYSRAILKKTWPLANKSTLSSDDRTKVNSIKGDVGYCAKELQRIVDNPQTPFAAIAGINAAIDYFGTADKDLTAYRPDRAIDPEKGAYQELRKLVEEIYAIVRARNAAMARQKEKPDALKLRDNAHLKAFDSERVAEETEEIAQEVAEAAQEEVSIKEAFEHFLEQQKKTRTSPQAANDETPSPPGPSGQPGSQQPNPPDKSQATGGATVEGWPQPPSSSTPSPGAIGQPATPSDRLRMLEARQQTLKRDVAGLQQSLETLPAPGPKASAADQALANARKAAAGELGQAQSDMGAAEKDLEAMREREDSGDKLADDAAESLDKASGHLAGARNALFDSLNAGREADPLVAKANELQKLADEYERTQSPEAKARLDKAVAEARRSLEPLEAAAAQQANPRPSGVQSGSVGYGRQTPSTGFAFPPPNESGADDVLPIARFLAARFWTLALQARKSPGPVIEGEQADAELHKLENTFYEETARYGEPKTKK